MARFGRRFGSAPKLDVGKKGVGFGTMERNVYAFYRKKGFSEERSRDIAMRTAGKIFWRKFPGGKGKSIIRRARR